MRQDQFFQTPSGRYPVKEFLDSLDSKEAKKVAWVLRIVRELDRIPTQYFQKLPGTDDLWEIRVQFGGNIFRILCFFDGGEKLILAHGFAKKSQKTPGEDIDLAEKRKREYFCRKEN